MSKRKQAMAAINALHRILNEADEAEADHRAQRASLEATRVEHEQEKARLERTKVAISEAETAHQKWLDITGRERLKANSEIDELQKRLEALRAATLERQQHHDSIVAGISALSKRLKVD